MLHTMSVRYLLPPAALILGNHKLAHLHLCAILAVGLIKPSPCAFLQHFFFRHPSLPGKHGHTARVQTTTRTKAIVAGTYIFLYNNR